MSAYENLDTTIEFPQIENPYVYNYEVLPDYDYNFYGSGKPINDSAWYENIDIKDTIKQATGLIGDIFKTYTKYDTAKQMIDIQRRQITQRENEQEYFKRIQNTQRQPMIIPGPSGTQPERYLPMPVGEPGVIIPSGNNTKYMFIIGVAILGFIMLKRRLF